MTENGKRQKLEESLRLCDGEMSLCTAHKPVIGITGNFRDGDCTLAKAYWASILEAGGIPVIIPPFDNTEAVTQLLDSIDGLLLSGGADIDPVFLDEEPLDCISVNPERDIPEMLLVRLAVNRHVPILGICRGIQLLTAALGGRLYQDIQTQHGTQSLQHSQSGARHERSHTVTVEKGSLLHSILGEDILEVNSFHHQAVKRVPEGFKAVATAPDGIIEAMESIRFRPILGVQWHPECMLPAGDRSMMPIFGWLIQQAGLYRQAVHIHRTHIILDSHCDTPMFFDKGARFQDRDVSIPVEYEYVGEQSPDGNPVFMYSPLVSLPKMSDGRLDASFMVAYLRQEERDESSLANATKKADRLLSLIEQRIASCNGKAAIARRPDELLTNKSKGIRSIVLGIENGYALGLNLNNVEHFANRGVAYITLCHNGDNDICDSAKGKGEHNGLSPFGRETVKEMNRLSVMVDLSHASEKSFYDTLELSSQPVICSHSSSRLLCNHPRNLTDDQLKALAGKGGVAQVCLYDGFIKRGGGATIHDAVRHIVHMAGIAGIAHIGIGSDFDGGGGLIGLEDASCFTELTRLLLAEGFTADEIGGIWGGNFIRVWQTVLKEKG